MLICGEDGMAVEIANESGSGSGAACYCDDGVQYLGGQILCAGTGSVRGENDQ
jgi:hypothetical protein